MNKLIEFSVPNGTVLVESEEIISSSVVRGASLARMTEKVDQSLPEALTVIRSVAEAATTACSGMVSAPDLVEVEFALKFEAGVGVLVAKSSGEGSLRIKVLWKRE